MRGISSSHLAVPGNHHGNEAHQVLFFAGSNDSIRTWRDARGHWFLGGSRQTGYLSGGAVCFDVASNQGEWSWGQGVPGSITGNLASNGTGGVACGLTELGGVFTTNAGSDGVHIGFSSNQSIWTLVNFKHAFANCIQ